MSYMFVVTIILFDSTIYNWKNISPGFVVTYWLDKPLDNKEE